jgi:hypothetical protein
VCNPASDKGNVLYPRKLDIGDEAAAAVQMAVVFLAREPSSDSLARHQRALMPSP